LFVQLDIVENSVYSEKPVNLPTRAVPQSPLSRCDLVFNVGLRPTSGQMSLRLRISGSKSWHWVMNLGCSRQIRFIPSRKPKQVVWGQGFNPSFSFRTRLSDSHDM